MSHLVRWYRSIAGGITSARLPSHTSTHLHHPSPSFTILHHPSPSFTILHHPSPSFPSSTNLLRPGCRRHHDALERHRPGREHAAREPGDQQVAPAGAHLDAQIGDAAAGAHLPSEHVLEIRRRRRERAPENEHGVFG